MAIIGALGLAGCGLATSYEISQMTPDELTKVSDADLCRPGGTSPAVTAERQKRDLGDCDRDHLYCHSLGLKAGTDGYVQCRLKAREIAAQEGATQQAASSAMLRASATLLAQPPPVPRHQCRCRQ